MSEFTKELERRIDAGWLTEPQDVRRMLKHSAAEGRNMAQHIYAYMDLWLLQESLYPIYRVTMGGNADLDTLKAAANGIIGPAANNFRVTKMEDTTSVLYRSITAISGCDSLESLAATIRVVQRFINMMFYAVDLAFPWDAMCQEYSRVMKDFVPPHRAGAVDVSDQ